MDLSNCIGLYDMAISHDDSLLCYYSYIDYRAFNTIDQMDQKAIGWSAMVGAYIGIGFVVLLVYGICTGFGDGQDLNE